MAEGDFEQNCSRPEFNRQLNDWLADYHRTVRALDFEGR
jgi:hypothetical protein